MTIGLKYGHCELGDQEAKAEMMSVLKEFTDAFTEEHGSLICKELIKYDVSKPEELQAAVESGIMFELCPKLAATACEILEDLI